MLFSRSLYTGGETDRQIGSSWTQCSEYYNRGRYGSCAEMTPILRELKAAKIIPAMVSGRIKGPKARKGPAFLETASGAVCLEGREGDQSGRWEGPDHRRSPTCPSRAHTTCSRVLSCREGGSSETNRPVKRVVTVEMNRSE